MGAVTGAGAEQPGQLGFGQLLPPRRGELGEQRARTHGVRASGARVVDDARERELHASHLESLAAGREQRGRLLPARARLEAAAARQRQVARHAVRHGVLQAVIGEPRQPAGAIEREFRLVQAADADQGLAATAFDLDDQVALGRGTLGQRQRLVVARERLFGPPAIEVELAQELERQHLLAVRAVAAGAFERREEVRFGLGEAPGKPRHVAEPEVDERQVEVIAQLEQHVLARAIGLRRARPGAHLLVHDAQVLQRSRRVRESAAQAVERERGLEVHDGRLPLAVLLVDESQVVARAGGILFVAQPAVEHERFLAHLARHRKVAFAVGRQRDRRERLGAERHVARPFGRRQRLLRAGSGFADSPQLEQRLGERQLRTRARVPGSGGQRTQDLAGLRRGRLRFTLGEAAVDGFQLE